MDEKKWYQSKTIWTQIFTFAITLGYLIDQSFGTKVMDLSFVTSIIAILQAIGVYSRKNAKHILK